jgi:uncharacterized protein YkwD
VPIAGVCANADVTPDTTNISDAETAGLCLINQQRLDADLQPLIPDADLQTAADSHAQDMITQDYFAHDGPAGDTPLSRIEASGYLSDPNDSYVIGENIAWGTLNLATPSEIVSAWMNSPEHRANILNSAYVDTAMSVVAQAPASLADGQSGAMWDQEFGGVTSD